ncbi:MAG: hypothetical protein WCO69_06305 [Candidatus Omnitrophota bacterium]
MSVARIVLLMLCVTLISVMWTGQAAARKIPGASSYERGQTKLAATFRVGLAGGTFTVKGTPMDGLVVSVPPNAWEALERRGSRERLRQVELSLSYDDGKVVQNGRVNEGGPYAIVFDAHPVVDGQVAAHALNEFSAPISFTVPSARANALAVPFYVNDEASLEGCQLVRKDPGHFVFDTFHPGLYVWVWALLP